MMSRTLTRRHSARQVHLSAVIPTDPIPSPAVGQPLMWSHPAGLLHTFHISFTFFYPSKPNMMSLVQFQF